MGAGGGISLDRVGRPIHRDAIGDGSEPSLTAYTELMRRCGITIVLLVMLAGKAWSAPSLAPGDYRFTLTSGGRERSYLVHVPASHPALPAVVLNFHGGAGNAKGQEKYSGMDKSSDRDGYLAVYPNGTGRLENRVLSWNAGTCCGYAMKNNVDDVAFTLALLDDLAAKTPIDRRRVYATGLSNGAMMAYRLAVEAGDRIAAIAPVAGSMVLLLFHPTRPMPIMHIHSADDPRALYNGGLGPPFAFTDARTLHPNVEQVLAQWRKFDDCPSAPKVDLTLKGKSDGPDDGNTATEYAWSPCADGTEIVLWKLTGSGHVWPGGTRDFYPRLLGKGTAVIDANRQMWHFFQRFALP